MSIKCSLLIFSFILFSGFRLFADGVQPEGAGTKLIPYQISTLDNLLWLSTNILDDSIYLVQVADIDASDTENWNDSTGFIPIGKLSDLFVGNYDGMGHKISNLKINRFNNDFQGLFGCVANSVIKNLRLSDFNICASDYVAGLVGIGYNTTIINCSVDNIYIRGWEKLGGIAGQMYVDNSFSGESGFSSISSCQSNGIIVGYENEIGGLVGCCINTEVYNCMTDIDSISGEDFVGGLIGLNKDSSLISNCFSISDVFGEANVGGLVGSNTRNSEIKYCHSLGNVVGERYVGGLVGKNSYDSYIGNCYSRSNISCSISYGGGFVGQSLGCIVSNCYCTGEVVGVWTGGFAGSGFGYENNFWDKETSGKESGMYNSVSLNVNGKSHIEMLDVATYTDTSSVGLYLSWDFIGNPFDDIEYNDIWNIDTMINDGYPFLNDSLVTKVVDKKLTGKADNILISNYPNPTFANTLFSFTISENSMVQLIIYAINGKLVRTLASRNYPKGNCTIKWEGKDDNNKTVQAGVYLCVLYVNYSYKSTAKCILSSNN